MSTGGVGVGGSEPVGTSAWTRLVIDKYTCMHAVFWPLLNLAYSANEQPHSQALVRK